MADNEVNALSVLAVYLISSASCGQLMSWEVDSPPALFILKWGHSLFSQNLSRVAGVYVHSCTCARECVCVRV